MKIKLSALLLALLGIMHVTACKKSSSEAAQADVPEKPAPVQVNELDRPINLRATKGDFGTQIIIKWTPMPLAKKYQLFKFYDIDQQYKLLKETSDTTFTDITDKPFIKNFYKVKSYNTATEYSPFSDVDYGYTSGQTYSKFAVFGSEGRGIGQFQFPTNVEVDALGNIYVSDESASIQKFDSDGKYIETFYKPVGSGTRGMAFLNNGNIVVTHITEYGNNVSIINTQKQEIAAFAPLGMGSGDGQFGNTRQICTDGDDNIYIVDQINNRVQKFDKNGRFLLNFGNGGVNPLNTPWGVCYLNNYIYVTSTVVNNINVYDKDGKYIRSFNVGAPGYCIKTDGESLFIGSGGYVIRTDVNGQVIEKIGQGQFSSIVAGVALTKSKDLIVSDVYGRKIFIFKKL